MIKKFGKWKRIDLPTLVFQWRIQWRVLKTNRNVKLLKKCLTNEKHDEQDVFCLPLKDEWKTLRYPRFFRYKTTWKTWRTRTQKNDSECFIVETILEKGKTRRAKIVHHILAEFISFDEKIMSHPEKFHSEH